MKKKQLLVIVLSLVLVLILATQVSAGGLTPRVNVTLLNQEPDPVEPGQLVDVSFKIENNQGGAVLEETFIELIAQEPYTIYRGPARQSLGNFLATSGNQNVVTVDYILKIADNAVEQEAELKVVIRTASTELRRYSKGEFTIDIRSEDAVVSVTDARLENGQVGPGKTGSLLLDVTNLADTMMRDLRVHLNLTTTPFIPYQGTNERRVSQLLPGFTTVLEYNLITKPDAAGGIYRVPITLRYRDTAGNDFVREEETALIIGEKPQLRAYIKETTVQRARQKGTITIELANSGATDIKFLQLTIPESEDYGIVGPTNTRYIGDVDSDDIETEDFDLYIHNKEQRTLPIIVEYTDVNNNPYTENIDLPLALYSSREISKFGLKEKSNTPLIIVVLILLGGGYWWWRKRKKKRKKK